jgi:hypothetical protein
MGPEWQGFRNQKVETLSLWPDQPGWGSCPPDPVEFCHSCKKDMNSYGWVLLVDTLQKEVIPGISAARAGPAGALQYPLDIRLSPFSMVEVTLKILPFSIRDFT